MLMENSRFQAQSVLQNFKFLIVFHPLSVSIDIEQSIFIVLIDSLHQFLLPASPHPLPPPPPPPPQPQLLLLQKHAL